MARTIDQIESSIAQSIENQDSSIDTVKGPIYDIFVAPGSRVVRRTELMYDDVSRRYSLDYVLSRDPSVLQLYGANHGLRRSAGEAASGHVVFYSSRALSPSEVTAIPAGTVVSTSDRTISYRTTRDAFIRGSSRATYYNASLRRYEVRVPVIALGSGDAFDVPPNRVRVIKDSIPGIDGVVNRERIEGGSPFESNSRFGTRIRSKFNGTAQGSGDGFKSLIMNFAPSLITDVAIIYSSDTENFRRRTRRSAWDVYIIGERSEEATATFIGDGVRRSFSLANAPVLAISSVTVDGNSVGFSLVTDSTDQTRRSTQADDRVELDSIPGYNSTIEVTYTYNRLVTDVQAYADTLSTQLYRNEILIREAIPVEIEAELLVQVLSSFDATDAVSSAFNSTSNYINTGEFSGVLYPSILKTTLASEVAGVSAVTLTRFTKKLTGTLPVDVVELRPFEYPVAGTDSINIERRR